MAYTYDPLFAVDPNSPSNIARNASILLFDPNDPAKTPVTLTDVTDVPVPNPIQVNQHGFGPAIKHATLDRLAWEGAGMSGVFTSYEGMKEEAVAARQAAEEAIGYAAEAAGEAVAAANVNPAGDLILTKSNGEMANAGSVRGPKGDTGDKGLDGSNVLPTDTAIKQAITTPGTETATALNATYGTPKLDKTEAAATYAVKGRVSSTNEIGAFVGKLKAGIDPAVVTQLGDSTGAAQTSPIPQLFRYDLPAMFPAYTFQKREWIPAEERHELVSSVLATGTAGARRYVATGASTDRFFTVADSAATSPGADIKIDTKIMLPNANATVNIGGKYDTATNNRSWFLTTNGDGSMSFYFSVDGTSATQYTRTCPVIPAAAIGVPAWFRFTFDGDNGAGGNTARFYYSLDNKVTWVQMGTDVVNAGVQSIFDSNARTQFVGRSGGSNAVGGAVEYYALQVFTDLSATARPVIDIETSQWNGYGSNLRAANGNEAKFNDFVGNVVEVDGTGNGGAMVGAPVVTLLNSTASGQNLAYGSNATRFPKLTPLKSDLTIINYSHNEVGLANYTAPYKALVDSIKAKWPETGIIAWIQNIRKAPAANITEHVIRMGQIRSLAAANRWAIVDAFALTAQDPALVSPDGIHPGDAGYNEIREKLVKPLFAAWN